MDLVKEFETATEKFGGFIVASEEEARATPDRAWSLGILKHGSYEMRSGSHEDPVDEYFLSARPVAGGDDLELVVDAQISCPTCDAGHKQDEEWDEDDCEQCEGSGCLLIHIPDCVGMRSDDEIQKIGVPG